MNLNNKQKSQIAQSATVIAFALAALAAAAHFTNSGSGGTEAALLEEQTEAETETEEKKLTEAMLAVTNEMAEKYADEEEEIETEEDAESGADNTAWFEALLAEEDLLDNSYVEAALKKTIRMVGVDGETGLHGDYISESYNSTGSFSGSAYTGYESYGNGYWSHIYDEKGNSLAVIVYDEEGNTSVDSTWEYKYDSEGRMLKKVKYDSDGEIESGDIYIYDDRGNIVKEASTYGYLYEYTYDSDGNMISKTARHTSDDEIYLREKYSYDADGNLTDVTEDFSGDRYDDRYEYTYDSNGNLLEIMKYGSSGMVEDWTEYSYENDGRVIADESWGVSDIRRSVYDSSGNLQICSVCDADGNEEYIMYEYDSDGRILYSYDSIVGKAEYTYNDARELASKEGFYLIWYILDDHPLLGARDYKAEYTYDSSGRLVAEYWINHMGYAEDAEYYIYVDYEYYN